MWRGRAGWQRKTLIMAAFSFFRSGGMPDEQGKELHQLILIEVDAGRATAIEVFCFEARCPGRVQ
jgi:hypothetical protein